MLLYVLHTLTHQQPVKGQSDLHLNHRLPVVKDGNWTPSSPLSSTPFSHFLLPYSDLPCFPLVLPPFLGISLTSFSLLLLFVHAFRCPAPPFLPSPKQASFVSSPFSRLALGSTQNVLQALKQGLCRPLSHLPMMWVNLIKYAFKGSVVGICCLFTDMRVERTLSN